MALTISEAAEDKGISRNAIWLAIKRSQITARKTSGGMWLVEQDARWDAYEPKRYPKTQLSGDDSLAIGGED